ncbi:MAG: flagellar motor switch protein FliG, partial [Ilumatobacteraceae bacterium]
MNRRKEEIPGARKSALLLLSMPQATAAKVLAHLDEEQVAEIATEIASLGDANSEATAAVLDDFTKQWSKRAGSVSGG